MTARSLVERDMEFVYKLNAMEGAAQEKCPADHDYYRKRLAVLEHARDQAARITELEAQVAGIERDAGRDSRRKAITACLLSKDKRMQDLLLRCYACGKSIDMSARFALAAMVDKSSAAEAFDRVFIVCESCVPRLGSVAAEFWVPAAK